MFLETKNPNPSTPIIADPFSLEALVAWLEKQPGEMEYNWYCTHGQCLIGQYMGHHGFGGGLYTDQTDILYERDPRLHDAFIFVACGTRKYPVMRGCAPWTFGAALIRARSLLTSSKGE